MAYSRAFSEESLREILLSLPVKSLCRFNCVCKNWGNLINNPSFTIDHCKKKKPPQHLIYDYGATDDASTVTLVSDKANREVRHLPAAAISFESFAVGRHLVFGLEPMTKNYKVLYYNQIEEYATIYSCSRDSWKIFEHNTDEKNNKCRILSFDFGNEVFVKMEGPPRGNEDYSWSANLMLLGDSVGILNFVDGGNFKRINSTILFTFLGFLSAAIAMSLLGFHRYVPT
ncbi:hypothetical protein KY289_025563 [Solanum tuberosum]|nr:hypothetical protein KY289_025563 [Solanum tuberosum]